jgi:hypothetical protein
MTTDDTTPEKSVIDWVFNPPTAPVSDPAYEAHMEAELARHERECGCPWTGGPTHDPYATACDLPKGHSTGPNPTDHSGPDPFGNNGRITWTRARGARELLRRYE